jgi:hypothetical protein
MEAICPTCGRAATGDQSEAAIREALGSAVSEPTTPAGRALLARIQRNSATPLYTPIQTRDAILAIEAEARALLLDELEAAVRELPEYGVLLNDFDSMHTGVVERDRVLALIQQHREAIR